MTDIREQAIRELDAAKAVKNALAEMTDDDEVIRDTLEGETNLDGIIRGLIISIEEDKALMAGLRALVEQYESRAERFLTRIAAKRELIRLAMELAEWQGKEFDVATVSLRKAAPALHVAREEDVPGRFWKPGKPTLDKTAMLRALKAGEQIEGASLKNGAPVLDIRTK